MGVVNVTPDSFSDGGDHAATHVAITAGVAMAEAGADILDVGGESTRPGSEPVPIAEEQRRVVPVVRALAASGPAVSVDKRNAATMAAALAAGARIINDVSALTYDPEARAVLAGSDCGVVLMHMRGTPATMMAHAEYRDPAVEVACELAMRVAEAEAAGIGRTRIAIDPGIGFAKMRAHNIDLLRRLPLLMSLGCPILVGVSRKSLIGRITGAVDPKRRGPGSLAAGLFAIGRGARILRVHDVMETVQAVRVWEAFAAGAAGPEG